MDLKFFLKNLPAFEEFNAAHLDAFANRLHIAEQENGHAFIRQGEQGDGLYLLLEGAVSIVRRDADGVDHEVRELCGGEMFGILSLVDDLPASATCTAHGKTKTASLTREAFRELFQTASPIGHHLQFMIAVQMARDLQEANKRSRAALAKS